MPTVEIISINNSHLDLAQDDLKIAIIIESAPISHRGLFADSLKQIKGAITHIGNPSFISDKQEAFFAGDIIDWTFADKIENKNLILVIDETNNYANQDYKFQFKKEYLENINHILVKSLNCSPDKKVLFLTDYQFGPEHGLFTNLKCVADFWKEHDKHGLAWNTLYEIG